MQLSKLVLGVWLLIFSLAVNGCTLFPSSNKTRPAPTRPKTTSPVKYKTPKVRPAPTKRTPGVSALTEKDINDRLSRIDAAVKRGDWSGANRETNALGIDMARYRPTGAKGRTLRDTANFNVMYTRLQADVKTKNKTACEKDVRNLQDTMKSIRTSSGKTAKP
ncbi:MAG: hypothetical protein ACM3X9_04535 [Bacillota bacterium]